MGYRNRSQSKSPWDIYQRNISDLFSYSLVKYISVFEIIPMENEWYVGPTLKYIDSMIGSGENRCGPPHGFDLLHQKSLPIAPNFPKEPTEPDNDYFGEHGREWTRKSAKELEGKIEPKRLELERLFAEDAAEIEKLRRCCAINDLEAIHRLMELTHVRHYVHSKLRGDLRFDLDLSAKIALCTIDIPDFSKLSIAKQDGKRTLVSVAERKRCLERILYALTLRAAYLVSMSDEGNWFDTVAVNANQEWHDPATGKLCRGITASFQAPKAAIMQLNLDGLDPKACFRHFKGISTPSMDQVAPVRPIFTMNTDDRRIIESRDVAEQMDKEANLAAMPWEDFEQLVRQLFEWEFGRNGVEVKVTRASRDRGVDAIMFDPDPLRGGKYVLQAKRYTRPVDVAAVRDLYGTVMNEGANRGILVTTSSYGPDSYDFAKDKPISLVDGQHLIAMLNRHGRRYRIDLAEARRLYGNQEGL